MCEYASHGRTEYIYSFQELCTEPCDMEPYIIMLKDEVMVADESHDFGLKKKKTGLTMVLRISSLYL
jgi:hypothetical protein